MYSCSVKYSYLDCRFFLSDKIFIIIENRCGVLFIYLYAQLAIKRFEQNAQRSLFDTKYATLNMAATLTHDPDAHAVVYPLCLCVGHLRGVGSAVTVSTNSLTFIFLRWIAVTVRWRKMKASGKLVSWIQLRPVPPRL